MLGFFDKYPYTDFHELNLDWLLKAVRELADEIKNFEIVNQFTYEGSWDITKQYKKYAIVTVNGTEGYISLQAVPAGVDISNADYWALIADYTAVIGGLGARVAALETETSNIKTRISNGSWLGGKKVVWYGDSWGTTANNPVEKFISKYTDVNVTNRCIGGTTMSRITISPHENDSGYQRIRSAADLANFDYIFIMYGINDWQVSVPLKTSSPDEYEYMYCVDNIISYLQSNYPNCIPVFIFPTYCYKQFASSDINGINYCGVNLPGYINNAISICERRNVKYINLFELSGITRINYATHLRNDGGIYVHLQDGMSDRVCRLIYEGHFNTGRCYGDSWSNNLILSSVDTSAVATRSDATTLINGIVSTPVKKITTNDYHNLMVNPCNEPVTVVHLTFYKSDSIGYGIYAQCQDIGDAVNLIGITNISTSGLVDCYFEVDTTDLINIMLITTSGTTLLNGISAEIKTTNKDIISNYPSSTAHSDITIDSISDPTIKNGIITIPSIQFTATADIAAFEALISGLPTGYSNSATYCSVVDTTNHEVVAGYFVNGTFRFAQGVVTGHTYIVPEIQYNTAH